MVDEIEGIGRKRGADEPLIWKPWQPPPGYVPPSKPDEAVGGVDAAKGPRLVGDRTGQGPLALEAASRWRDPGKPAEVDLDHVEVPDTDDLFPATPVGAEKALGELGVIGALAAVAAAYVQSPVSFKDMAASLGAFAGTVARVSAQLAGVPGVSEALAAFGGADGIVLGVTGFRDELESARQVGPSLGDGLEAAANAALLLGGVATALGALCPPLAPVGAAILAAGAALKLGKLGWEHRDAAAEGFSRIISDKGASIASEHRTAIISNNGANMVGDRAFRWLTG